ncbi:integrase, catalytic region, zinc finger, CCHC-type containing protein [Tanacetum coccineum]
MMRNRLRLKNFVKKFIGTVRFGNDHFSDIIGYGDYVIGDSVISKSINGKKYILVIVDDYSRFTWAKFLRSKDEIPEDDYKEYKISEADFKNLHSNDFEDLYLLHLQDLQLGIKSYQTKLNLSRDGMQLTFYSKKITPFSTSQGPILEKLDFMVKDYELFKFNPGMEHRIWSEDDKWRSQEFIKLIERRLKIRSISS